MTVIHSRLLAVQLAQSAQLVNSQLLVHRLAHLALKEPDFH